MAWNATIGVNERYRRLRYVVNGPSLVPSRARIHLSISYTLHVPIYTHNIELPTFSSYQSKDWQRTIENTNDETSPRSQTKLDNSLLYDRSQRNRESSRYWWPPWWLYTVHFWILLPNRFPDKIAFTRKYCTGRNAFWLCSHKKRHRISTHHRESVVPWHFSLAQDSSRSV